jgi:hypothetical protein
MKKRLWYESAYETWGDRRRHLVFSHVQSIAAGTAFGIWQESIAAGIAFSLLVHALERGLTNLFSITYDLHGTFVSWGSGIEIRLGAIVPAEKQAEIQKQLAALTKFNV